MSRVATVRDGVDFAESLRSFLLVRVAEMASAVFRTDQTGEQFAESFGALARRTAAEVTLLCRRCFDDGQAGLERLVRSRVYSIHS